MYQKVHLLVDDIAVVAAEGDERCLGGPRIHRTPFRFSELYTTVIFSTEITHTLNHEKTDAGWGEDQKLKINLEVA